MPNKISNSEHSVTRSRTMYWNVEKIYPPHVILLDGMYGFEQEYHRWFAADKKNKITFVARGTKKLTLRFIRRYSNVIRKNRIPRTFSQKEKLARIVYLDSQFGHSALVSSKKVIPLILQLTRLAPLGKPE